MFRSLLFNHPQRAICRALCCYYNVFRWFAFVEYLHGMWLYVCVICLCVCLVLLSVFTNRTSADKSTKHTHKQMIHHTAPYQVNTQRTQTSGRHCSSGIWPSEDSRIKWTETCRGFLVFTNMFLTF